MIRRPRCAQALLTAVALAAIPLSARAETTTNLLTNPGAETGNLSGWIGGGTGPGLPGIDNGTFGGDNIPLFSGNFDFVGGIESSGSLSQTVPLNGFAPTPQQIDNGQVTYNASFAERSYPQLPADGAGLSFTFLDPNGIVITGNNPPPIASTGGWAVNGLSSLLPVNSRQIIYAISFVRNSGNDLDAFVDNNLLTVTYPGSSWKGAATGNWSNAAAWNSGVPLSGPALLTSPAPIIVNLDKDYDALPTNPSELYVDAPGAGATILQSTNIDFAADTQYIGNTANATYSQSNGQNQANNALYLGFYPGSHGTYNLSGQGGFFSNGTLHIGAGGTGNFSMSGSTIISVSSISIGDSAGSSGNLSISGGFAYINNTLNVGGAGAASLFVNGGITTDYGTLIVANAANAGFTLAAGRVIVNDLNLHGTTARLHWTGGVLEFSHDLHIDTSGPFNANFALQGAQQLAVDGIMFLDDSTNNSFTLNGGSATLSGLYIASNFSSDSNMYVQNANASLSVNNAFIGGTAADTKGFGNLFISNGSATIRNLTLWTFGKVTLTGGTLAVNNISAVNPASFQWSAGTLQFLSDQTVDSSFFLGSNVSLTGSKSLVFASLTNNGNISGTPNTALSAATLVNGLSANITTAGSVLLTSANPSTNLGTINVSGLFQTAAPLVNVASLTLSGPQSWAPGATLTNIAGTTSFQSNAKLYGLTISGGTVDITASKLVIQPADKSAALASLRNNISAHSLISSAMPANFALALIDNALLNLSTFGGQPIDTNSLLLSEELLGDTNIDGKVDLTDLSTLLQHFGTTTSAWTSGNFDNAPTIDLTDIADLLNNFGASNPNANNASSPATTATPEPSSLCLFTSSILLMTKRRLFRRVPQRKTKAAQY